MPSETVPAPVATTPLAASSTQPNGKGARDATGGPAARADDAAVSTGGGTDLSALTTPRAPRNGRLIGGVVGGLAVLLLGAVGWKVVASVTADPPGRPGAGAVAVNVAPVEVRDLRHIGRYSGTVRPAREVTVAPQIGGQIERIFVDLGDVVEPNAVLFELDTREANQRVNQSDADLRVARASLQARQADLAARNRDLQRLRELFDENARIVTRADVDAAESAVEQAEANVAVAEATVTEREAALEAARIRRDLSRVRATWFEEIDDDGPHYVAARHRDIGDTVSANTPVLSIVDLQRVRVVVTVPERAYVRLRRGQRANIEAEAFPGRAFEGTVTRIAPSFDDALREARVEIEVDNEDLALKPGMFVRVRLVFETLEAATAVPATALVTRGGQRGVLQVMTGHGDGPPQARFVPVTVGIRDGEHVHVVEPNLDGWVVTLGAHLAEDGAPLRIVESNGQDQRPR